MKEKRPQLVVAMDAPDAQSAAALGARLTGYDLWMKIGLELFIAAGPMAVEEFRRLGFRIFLDLKLFDIPNTVAGAVASACRLNVDMLTLHAMGGRRMLEAAVEARDNSSSRKPLLVGVTALTSMTVEELPLATDDMSNLVVALAKTGKEAGLDGAVCSGWEAAAMKEGCGGDFICVTPGIRPHKGDDDQRRVMTPSAAIAAGSDFLVVGRPITQASDPVEAVEQLLEQINDSGL